MPRSRFPTDYIFEQATSAAGMNKKDAARFHAFNPNGVVAKLPTDFSLPNGMWATGCESMWSRYHSYHAKQIQKYALGKTRFTRWELDYTVRECVKELEECTKRMAEKRENVAQEFLLKNPIPVIDPIPGMPN